MKVLISGSSGMAGSALGSLLSAAGHEVLGLSRRSGGSSTVHWDPEAGQIDAAALEGVDAAVHLAGESITGRWTAAKKRRIMDSRAQGTRLLAETLAGLKRPPRVLVSASAVGYYGDRGAETLTEESGPGALFLSEVCKTWEDAASPAEAKGIRVANLRFGIILSPAGGALPRLLLPFRLGLGGRVGSGEQYMSWIALDDAAGAIYHSLTTESVVGPANATSPNPVTNREFTRTLGRVLRRPTLFPLPAFAARALFGQMADELLLASARVMPERLLASGYEFRYPQLEDALRHVLGR